MTTSDLERRLAEVLQQHAEETMNSTRTEEQLSTLLEDAERQERRRRLGWAGGALAAAAAAAVLVVWSTGGSSDPPETAVPAQEAPAEDVATSFVDAYASFERDTAASYLDPDAWIALGDGEDWRRVNRWFEAVSFEVLAGSCEAQPSSPSGTPVRCPFDFHALGSDELGRGPYSGNVFTFTVQDGRIVAADQSLDFLGNGFSKEMWEPFSAWVAETYPKDAAVMYADWPEQSLESHTDRSIRLWAEHVRDYVQAEKGR